MSISDILYVPSSLPGVISGKKRFFGNRLYDFLILRNPPIGKLQRGGGTPDNAQELLVDLRSGILEGHIGCQ